MTKDDTKHLIDIGPVAKELKSYKEYLNKKPSALKNIEDHISIQDKIECWAKHKYKDNVNSIDQEMVKFFCLNDKMNLITVETHIIRDSKKYLGCLNENQSLDI